MFRMRRHQLDSEFINIAHYPIEPRFNIFHMHTFGGAYEFGEKQHINYINVINSRSIIWSKTLKYVDYSNKDILIKLKTPLNKEDISRKYILDNSH